MGFKIIVSNKAQEEIENAIEYYAEINLNLAFRFYSELTETYKKTGAKSKLSNKT